MNPAFIGITAPPAPPSPPATSARPAAGLHLPQFDPAGWFRAINPLQPYFDQIAATLHQLDPRERYPVVRLMVDALNYQDTVPIYVDKLVDPYVEQVTEQFSALTTPTWVKLSPQQKAERLDYIRLQILIAKSTLKVAWHFSQGNPKSAIKLLVKEGIPLRVQSAKVWFTMLDHKLAALRRSLAQATQPESQAAPAIAEPLSVSV